MINPGQRFGRWTVIEKLPKKKGHSSCLCRCDCGTVRAVRNGALIKGNSKSCGCLMKDNPSMGRPSGPRKSQIPYSERRLRFIKSRKVISARDRDILYTLSDNILKELLDSPCHYCGAVPSNHSSSENFHVTYQGIDRKNPDLGYQDDNVVPCCHACNRKKGTTPYQEYMETLKSLT